MDSKKYILFFLKFILIDKVKTKYTIEWVGSFLVLSITKYMKIELYN